MAQRGKRGFSLIEVLVASIVASVAVLGMVRLWSFSFNTTKSSDQQGVGYNVGRLALERIKMSGFDYTAEGTVVRFYDKEGKGESSLAKATSMYKLTMTVETDLLGYHSETAETRPAPDALREVTVSVERLEDSRNVFTGKTNLARSGL